MKTTRERAGKVTPLEKFDVLATDIDLLRQRVENIHAEQSMDDLLELIEVEQLAAEFGVTFFTMRKKLISAGGQVVKIGKKWVIRKISYLQVLENLEGIL